MGRITFDLSSSDVSDLCDCPLLFSFFDADSIRRFLSDKNFPGLIARMCNDLVTLDQESCEIVLALLVSLSHDRMISHG
jgi:hypothetical protein